MVLSDVVSQLILHTDLTFVNCAGKKQQEKVPLLFLDSPCCTLLPHVITNT